MFDATYTLLDGPIKPFGVAGLGWNWVNTNIRHGPPQAGCWYDPWWGYVCNGYQPTHGASSFAYQIGAGVQFNFNRQFAIDADYKYTWIDLHNASSTPGIGGAELLFVWRFTGYWPLTGAALALGNHRGCACNGHCCAKRRCKG